MLGRGLIVVIEIEEKAELLDGAKATTPLHLTLDCQTLGRGVKVLGVAMELLLKLSLPTNDVDANSVPFSRTIRLN